MKPKLPPDIKHCPSCHKIIGPHGGWFGAECQCDIDLSKAAVGHSIKAGTRRD